MATIPTPLRSEYIGTESNRVDVSDWTPRRITVYALDVALKTQHDLTMMRAGLHMEFANIREQIAPKKRDADESWHEFDAPMMDLKGEIRRRTSDPADPLTERGAAALVEGALVAIRDRREAAIWRAVKSWPIRALSSAGTHAITAAVAAGLTWLAHYLILR